MAFAIWLMATQLKNTDDENDIDPGPTELVRDSAKYTNKTVDKAKK